MNTKKRLCSYKNCGSLHRHHEWTDDTPDPPTATCEVQEDYPDDKPIYCSITCACYDGAYSVTKGWLI